MKKTVSVRTNLRTRDRGAFRQCEREVEAEGHLIDSMILTRIWARIMELGGDFEVLEFKVGRRKTDKSYVRMSVKADSNVRLDAILGEIYKLGAVSREVVAVRTRPARADKVLPDGFYSTTNNPTAVYFGGKWVDVEGIMMDKIIVIDPTSGHARCMPMREVRKNDLVVIGEEGLRVIPPERPRGSSGVFRFMSSEASSEKPAVSMIRQIAQDLSQVKKTGGKVVAVVGPAVIHTGASRAFAKLVHNGYIDALLTGNALAVHDVEAALLKTSLGVSLENGSSTIGGNRNHLVAINEIYKSGGLEAAAKKGVLKEGIIFECVKRGVPFVLAGSIRDDGPLPEVVTDMIMAQQKYREHLKDVSMVLMLATTLHSIAVGNMLPSTVKLVCVDISQATMTKLLDRGSTQAVGMISDIGTFLPLLVQELEKTDAKEPSVR